MRKVIIGMATALAVFGACSAEAGCRGCGGGNWVAPLVGGMVAGGIIYGLTQSRAYSAPPPPPPVYYEQPRYRRECWLEPVYDYAGQFVQNTRVCRDVPNY